MTDRNKTQGTSTDAREDRPSTGGTAREALDAESLPRLKQNPGADSEKLDIGVDESFPASDPPAITQPCKPDEPLPSTGFKG